MRTLVSVTLLAIALPWNAYSAPSDLVGMSALNLVSCAGVPASQMTVGDTTFLQYGDSRQIGTFQQFGQIGTFQRHETGCEVTIAIKDGVVIDVQTHPYGGLLTGPMACDRIFSACHP